MTVLRLTPAQVKANQVKREAERLRKSCTPEGYNNGFWTEHTACGSDGKPIVIDNRPKPSASFQHHFDQVKSVVAEYMNGTKARSFGIVLPWPPTVNHNSVPTTSGGRTLTEAHRYFRFLVARMVFDAKLPKLYGRLRVYIVAHPPDNRPRDLDNLIKPTLDALQRAGAIENDKNIDDLHIVRSTVEGAGFVDVRVTEI